MRPCEIFLQNRGELPGKHGYESDPGNVNRTDDGITFYHYTNRNKLEQIMREEESGLYARLPVLHSDKTPEFEDCYLVEALLEPLPRWTTCSPYFGDVGLALLESYVGDFLLKLGYDVTNGHETTRSDVHSWRFSWPHVMIGENATFSRQLSLTLAG